MINKSKFANFLSLNLIVAAMIFASGSFSEAAAQRDPFEKPGWAKTREVRTGGTATGTKKAASAVTGLGVPAIDQRIEFYKRQREYAAANGTPLPKVTSVLTLSEMDVTGIFKTPRGYAAMVEATPIKLSYTIYPGDKFFDGQLVAVEENRLVFRRVSKLSNGKFMTAVENKALRQYTVEQTVQGTAPVTAEARSDAPAAAQPLLPAEGVERKVAAGPIVSPFEELSKQAANEPEGDKMKKEDSKKPVKVARKKN